MRGETFVALLADAHLACMNECLQTNMQHPLQKQSLLKCYKESEAAEQESISLSLFYGK
jgi:hypothetical protein